MCVHCISLTCNQVRTQGGFGRTPLSAGIPCAELHLTPGEFQFTMRNGAPLSSGICKGRAGATGAAGAAKAPPVFGPLPPKLRYLQAQIRSRHLNSLPQCRDRRCQAIIASYADSYTWYRRRRGVFWSRFRT